MALHSLSGKNGYASQTIYNVMEFTAMTPMMTPSPPSPRQQLLQPQQALPPQPVWLSMLKLQQQSQMVALSFSLAPAQQMRGFVARNAFQVPPIQQVAIPLQQTFPMGSLNAERGGRHGGPDHGRRQGRQGYTQFADYIWTLGAMPTIFGQTVPYGGGIAPPVVQQ
jgi:hypothetical protein